MSEAQEGPAADAMRGESNALRIKSTVRTFVPEHPLSRVRSFVPGESASPLSPHGKSDRGGTSTATTGIDEYLCGRCGEAFDLDESDAFDE